MTADGGSHADIDLSAFGADLKDADLGEREHRPELDRRLRGVPADELAMVDLSAVEFVGYAWARKVLVPCVQGVVQRRYPLRWLVLRDRGGGRDVALEGLAQALAEHRLSLILLMDGQTVAFGYLSREQPFEGRRANQKRQKMLNILAWLHDRGEQHTNEIAAGLGLTLPNCNFLLAELAAQGLVERLKQSHPSGGPVYLNRPAPPALFAPAVTGTLRK